MGAVDTFRNNVPFLRKQPKLSRDEAMAVRPVRNSSIKWSKQDDEITLFIPMRQDRMAKMFKRIYKFPDTRQIGLDEVGSTVWELCDGKRNLSDIVRELCAKYKLSRREAETSVAAFFKMLAQKNLIGLVPGGEQKG